MVEALQAAKPGAHQREGNLYPPVVQHWLGNEHRDSIAAETFSKLNPATGEVLGLVARGRQADADRAIVLAVDAYPEWRARPVIQRADLLRKVAQLMQERQTEIAHVVALETGKSPKDALGEVGAAIEMGYFIAGEGRRYYGHTTNSAMAHRSAMTVRQSIGPCALIIAANTPIANVAWKAFPALVCGNTAILKASEDTPYTAILFAELLKEAGLPAGVFSVLQGFGEEAGAPLVEDERIRLVSFTGSVSVGRYIQKVAGERLAKVCLELGGKNPLIVCDDADLHAAADAALLSAFSNAGQRCASASRILVFESVYEQFKQILLKKTNRLKIGPSDADDLGPVINAAQLNQMLNTMREAVDRDGAVVLCGGDRLNDAEHQNGFYMAPTILENVSPQAAISREEFFGPITCLYPVKDFNHAVELANDSPMGLTAAIHTTSIHRAQRFTELSQTGVVSINGPTYGSEPHMPFGGLRNSGNGFREAGMEALDVYSDWKSVYVKYDPEKI